MPCQYLKFSFMILTACNRILSYVFARLEMASQRFRRLEKMITVAQIRAARAMLNWHQSELAERSNVSLVSIKNLERGAVDARSSTLQKIKDAFEQGGEVVLEAGTSRDGGPGVRLKA